MADFSDAVDEVQKIEKKPIGYSSYTGNYKIDKTLDLEPEEYVDITYSDLLKHYERISKILSTFGMGVLSKDEKDSSVMINNQEIEQKIKNMTNESLKSAEEVSKKEIPKIEKIEIEKESERKNEIEFETEVVSKSQTKEVKSDFFEEKSQSQVTKSTPTIQEEKTQIEPPKIVVTLPKSIEENPNEAGSKKFEEIETQMKSTMGEATDELSIKRKMLELTKALFKEKKTTEREKIKLEITLLKNMLAEKSSPGKSSISDSSKSRLLETLVSSQKSEISQTKDSIIDSYKKQMDGLKKKFNESISSSENESDKKKTYDAFVFSLTSLLDQLPAVIKKYQDYMSKKHVSELERFSSSVSSSEPTLTKKSTEYVNSIKANYSSDFSSILDIVKKEVEGTIDLAGGEIFKKQNGDIDPEAKAHEILVEINDMDEGTLLYYLHSKQPEYYKKYEFKLISKAEAILKSKALLAKEKGLGESTIKKYFTEEG